MSAGPAPHIAPEAGERKHAPDKSSATASAWLLLPDEEKTRYLPKKTPLKPYIAAHFISNDGAAAPKISRRRPYTPAERKRVATTRKYGACQDCRTRKITCSHVTIPSTAVNDYLRETQQHEIFALALNTPSSPANVNVHTKSIGKQIAEYSDKLCKPQDNTNPSTGAAIGTVPGKAAAKAVLSPATPITQPAPSRRKLKVPAKVCNGTRSHSQSRTPQPGTGKFRVQTESTSRLGHVKPVVPGSKNPARRPSKVVEQLNEQATSTMIVISHEPPPNPAHVGKSNHERRDDHAQRVVTNHHPRASYNQNQRRQGCEARLAAPDIRIMHKKSTRPLVRQPSSSSEMDSMGSDMGEMITPSARSASSNGDFRPPTPLDCGVRLFPVAEQDITFTKDAVPTEFDVTESNSTQALSPLPSDDLSISWTEFLHGGIGLDDEFLNQDGMAGLPSDSCALFSLNGEMTMPKEEQSAMVKQPFLPWIELMDVDKA